MSNVKKETQNKQSLPNITKPAQEVVPELRDVLLAFQLPQLVDKLISFGITTARSLFYITELDLNSIFSEKVDLALKVEFRHKLQRWRNRNTIYYRNAEPLSWKDSLPVRKELNNQMETMSRIEKLLLAKIKATKTNSNKHLKAEMETFCEHHQRSLTRMEKAFCQLRSKVQEAIKFEKNAFGEIENLLDKMQNSSKAAETKKRAYELPNDITIIATKKHKSHEEEAEELPSSSQKANKNPAEEYSIEQFLAKNPLFIYNFCCGENRETLTKAGRKGIVDSAIKFYKNRMDSMGAFEFVHVANEICKQFPKESIRTYYYTYSGQCAGMLRAAIEETTQERERNKTGLHSNAMKFKQDKKLSKDPIIVEYKEWLKLHSQCEEGFDERWSKTRDVRLTEIGTKCKDQYAFIRAEWPAYFRSNTLFEQDFEHFMFCNTNGLRDNWEIFCSDFQAKASTLIRDKNTMLKWNSSNFNENSNKDLCDAAFFDLLSAVMPPTAFFKSTTTDRYWKVKIEDSQKYFILRVENKCELQVELIEIKAELKEYNLPFQPIIVILGVAEKLEFIGMYNNEEYHYSSLLDAVSNMLKFQILFNIQYMRQSAFIWQFIQRYFFQIETRPCSNGVQKALEHFGYESL